MKVTLDIPEDFDKQGYFLVKGEVKGKPKFYTSSQISETERTSIIVDHAEEFHKRMALYKMMDFILDKVIQDAN